jgi:hypothetical protein
MTARTRPPRPPQADRPPEEQAAIKKLDDELAYRWPEFVNENKPVAQRISELIRQLDKLRPEWKGEQYRTPIAERQRLAAENFFNEP